MKRYFAIIFALLLCVSAFVIAASAADGEISLTSTAGQPGQQVVVDVKLSGNPGVAYLKIKIGYDANVLALNNVQNTGLLEGTFTTSKTSDVNPYVLQWMAAGDSDSDGIIASLTFDVLETAAFGSYAITLSVEECYDEQFHDVTFSAKSGMVMVGDAVCTHASKTEVPYCEPGCEEPGNNLYYICDTCGKVFKADGVTETTVEAETIEEYGHEYSYEMEEPSTCTQEGYLWCYCYRCGRQFVMDELPIDPDNHTVDCWYMVEILEENTPGLIEGTCTGCGTVVQRAYSYSASSSSDQIISLSKAFQNALDGLDRFWSLDAYYMIQEINDIFCAELGYGEYLCVPAELYEAVLDMYFVASPENIQQIRSCYSDSDSYEDALLWYREEDQTYTIISYSGGVGGIMASRGYAGYVKHGDTYDVFYGYICYQWLSDILPEDIDCWEYYAELGWPRTIVYDGIVYHLDGADYMDYYAIAGYEPRGNQYTVEIKDGIVRILSCRKYTQEDLPDQFAPESTYQLPQDGSVTIQDRFWNPNCFEDGTTVTIERIQAGQTWDEITRLMEAFAVKYIAYSFTASKDGEPVQPVGSLGVQMCVPSGFKDEVVVYYLNEAGMLEEVTWYTDYASDGILVDLQYTGIYILAEKPEVIYNYDWSFANGVLTISGTGDMPDFDWEISSRPWAEYINQITSVVIEEGITYLGVYTFINHEIESITLPASLKLIGFGALDSYSLQQIVVADGNAVFATHDGVLFSKDMSVLLLYPSSRTVNYYEIPSTVTVIESCAFYNAQVRYVEIPMGVTAIRAGAFQSSALTSIVIPASVTDLGDMAFAHCPDLTSITFLGDAPVIVYDCFENVSATAFYPANNTTWTDVVKLSYEGNLTWKDDTWITSIIQQPENLFILDGAAGTVRVEVIGMGLRYQWEFRASADEQWNDYYPGHIATASNFFEKNFVKEDDGIQLRCRITDLYGNVVYSNVITVQILSPSKLENVQNAWYTVSDLVMGEDGIYRTPDGAKVYIAVKNEADGGIREWLGGYTLFDFVEAYGADYFDMTHWEDLLALMDEEGYVELTEESLGYLISVTTGNPAWNETEEDVVYYLFYDYPEEVCQHTYVSEVTVEATCIESGVMTYTCSLCGDAYTEIIPAIGHSYQAVVTVPTCTESGYTTHTCANCGATYTSDHVDPLDHNYEAVTTAPTCTEQGYTTHTCANCGDSYTDSYTEATGHSWDEGVVTQEPTMEAEGEKTYTCTVCGETRTEVLPKREPVIYDIPEDDSVEIPENNCFEGGTTVFVEKVEDGEIYDKAAEALKDCAQVYTVFEFTATKDGASAQPNGKLTVNFSIPADYSTNVAVYYMDESGKLTKLEIRVDTEKRAVTVELEHFSTYILTDEDTVPSVLPGDANGDGRVNARDARLLLRFIAGLTEEGEVNEAALDFNGDGRVNARDARAILQYIAGLTN